MRIGGVLESLGRRHVDYGATLETYDIVKEAFLWVVERALGESFVNCTIRFFAVLFVQSSMRCCRPTLNLAI